MRISRKRQISIPKRVMDSLNLKPGDEVEFELYKEGARIVPVRTIKVPREQAWFWTPEWQEMEKQADLELSSGQYRDSDNLSDLLRELHGED
jgi:AbrB family looped-hinge helix DNA binding protein